MRPVLALLAFAFVLAACARAPAPDPEPIVLSPEQAARVAAVWTGGSWDGTWGGTCTGRLDVTDVQGGIATVDYRHGICGEDGRAGGTVYDDAIATETSLAMSWRDLTWTYELQSDGSLAGTFTVDGEVKGKGRFLPVPKT